MRNWTIIWRIFLIAENFRDTTAPKRQVLEVSYTAIVAEKLYAGSRGQAAGLRYWTKYEFLRISYTPWAIKKEPTYFCL